MAVEVQSRGGGDGDGDGGGGGKGGIGVGEGELTTMGNSPLKASYEPLQTDQLPITTATTASPEAKKLKLIPLIFLIYFEVSGGPFGEEPAVQAAGPLFAILGFMIFPLIWSIPEALITAELATTFPGNGGYVIWANRAFGPFWGSLMGSWKFLSGVINNAAYPVLCADYLKLVLPIFSSEFVLAGGSVWALEG
uniref:Uncharacterized protein n=1 Tax=Nelumbo nucifera TaxID=4432 RepID=A0A822YGN2_NELNU|nr:TPA_asm: hypothetical protein HUJ06_031574 [Nelumbo nucifera]